MTYEHCDWHFHWKEGDLRLEETVIEMAYDLAYTRGWKPKKWYKPWTWGNWVKCYDKKTKHQIIVDMCYCMRHDYGIVKTEDGLDSGMTPKEREALYSEMKEVYNTCIEPYMEIKTWSLKR